MYLLSSLARLHRVAVDRTFVFRSQTRFKHSEHFTTAVSRSASEPEENSSIIVPSPVLSSSPSPTLLLQTIKLQPSTTTSKISKASKITTLRLLYDYLNITITNFTLTHTTSNIIHHHQQLSPPITSITCITSHNNQHHYSHPHHIHDHPPSSISSSLQPSLFTLHPLPPITTHYQYYQHHRTVLSPSPITNTSTIETYLLLSQTSQTTRTTTLAYRCTSESLGQTLFDNRQCHPLA